MYRSVFESVFQPASAAAQSCAKYNTDLAGRNHPKSDRHVSCASCGRVEEVQGKHKRCSACKAVYYCSETCQKVISSACPSLRVKRILFFFSSSWHVCHVLTPTAP